MTQYGIRLPDGRLITDPEWTCPADVMRGDHVPVEVRSRTTGQIETVARLCLDCSALLHPGWGCDDCVWESYVTRTLSEAHDQTHFVLAAPCKEHNR